MSTTNSEPLSGTNSKKKHKSQPKIDSKLKREIEYFLKMIPTNDIDEIPPSSIDKIAITLEHQIGEWLRSFVILGFTYDGKPLKLYHTPSGIDAAAVDNILAQSAIEQQTINNVIIKQNVSDFFNGDFTDGE